MSHSLVSALPADAVTLKDGHPITTSRAIANVFGKQHQHVLRAIRDLDCPADFRRSNFGPSKYLNEQGKEQPMIEMTKNGMVYLVMGFTGPQAARFKIAYIEAFDAMELALRQHAPAILEELLRAHPEWVKLRQCLAAGLTGDETARVLNCGETTVRRYKRRMVACGLLPIAPAAIAPTPSSPAALGLAGGAA